MVLRSWLSQYGGVRPLAWRSRLAALGRGLAERIPRTLKTRRSPCRPHLSVANTPRTELALVQIRKHLGFMRWQFAEMAVAQGTISSRLANHTQLLGARIRLTSDATPAECLECSQELLCGCRFPSLPLQCYYLLHDGQAFRCHHAQVITWAMQCDMASVRTCISLDPCGLLGDRN
jgi:hypothetical protein